MSGTTVFFSSPEDVIIHKIVAARPRDIEDARSILVKNPALDQNYIRSWLRDFDKPLDEDFTRVFDGILERQGKRI